MLFLALSPCNHTLPTGTRTRVVVALKFLPFEYGTSITSPPTPTTDLEAIMIAAEEFTWAGTDMDDVRKQVEEAQASEAAKQD